MALTFAPGAIRAEPAASLAKHAKWASWPCPGEGGGEARSECGGDAPGGTARGIAARCESVPLRKRERRPHSTLIPAPDTAMGSPADWGALGDICCGEDEPGP